METPIDIELTEESLNTFYTNNFDYYTKLSVTWKKTFVNRALEFIDKKQIISHNYKNVSNKVKAIISASAVQLTLGLENWSINYFDTIILHPDDFRLQESGARYKGLTNLDGYIRLSFNSFLAGYKDKTDNINLGLHEFTHALRFNSIRGFEQDYFVEHFLPNWLSSAYEIFNDMQDGKPTLFREYGSTNINEFMSVCIEHFFESPQQIREHYPILYINTALMLNQTFDANGIPNIGSRENLFFEKNKLLQPFTKWHVKNNISAYQSFTMFLITFALSLFTFIKLEISNPCVGILAALTVLLYLRFDYKFSELSFSNIEFSIKKGFSIFRFFKRISFPISNIISVGLIENTHNTEITLIYFNTNNTYFYEETIYSKKFETIEFLSELKRNKIAIFKK